MLTLDHPNIVKTVEVNSEGVYQKNGKANNLGPFMVMEYAERGLLFDYVIFSGKFSEEISRVYIAQLIDGIYK